MSAPAISPAWTDRTTCRAFGDWLQTRRYLGLLVVLMLVAIPYLPSLQASFLGGDDFAETARAAFEDSHHPLDALTTLHFGYKYRPLDRLINLATYSVAGYDPFAFRLRNLLLHLATVIAVGALAEMLTRKRLAGLVAALVFGLSHVAHPVVTMSITTKTILGLACVLSVVFTLRFVERPGLREALLLVGSFLVAILSHETGLGMVVPIIFWLLWSAHKGRLPGRAVVARGLVPRWGGRADDSPRKQQPALIDIPARTARDDTDIPARDKPPSARQ